MPIFTLRPSDIMFSQRSIRPAFYDGNLIGDVRDMIVTGEMEVEDLPMISVKRLRDGRFLTTDNRRLWVFKELEDLGEINFIQARKINWIPEHKWGYKGYHVNVRGDPGGFINYDYSETEDEADDEYVYETQTIYEIPGYGKDEYYETSDSEDEWCYYINSVYIR